jgi:hypothetical protein
VIAEIAPAEIVNLRFPDEWSGTAPAPAPGVLAFASADANLSLFSPTPIGGLPDAKAEQPEAEVAKPAPPTKLAGIAPAKPQVAAAPSKAPAAPTRRVLSESQLASIKKRLNLTPEQERYWPAVAAQLRRMEYKRDGNPAQGSRMAQVDMSKVDIDGLKSAGFPLVMSFNDDQRRELRSLAHLLGLENVMSGF